MPQKSIEQYERELMEMYRLALAKDPNYAALARRQSAVTVRNHIPEEEKISVTIPAPGVEEAVPLPRGIEPVPPGGLAMPAPVAEAQEIEQIEQTTVPQTSAPPPVSAGPPAVAVVLPMPERAPRPDTGMQTRIETPARTDARTGTAIDINADADANPDVDANSDAEIDLDATPETESDTDIDTGIDAESGVGFAPQVTTPRATTPQVTTPRASTGQQAPSGLSRPATPPASEEAQRITTTPDIGAGNLIVNVTTQNRTKPVVNAVVMVSHPDESGNKVVARVVTDSSGKTELIRLPAPIREIPVYPQPMTGGDLSTKYLVDVEAPGFESVFGEEISVFDGVTSVKRIDLTVESGGGRTANNAAAENRIGVQRE